MDIRQAVDDIRQLLDRNYAGARGRSHKFPATVAQEMRGDGNDGLARACRASAPRSDAEVQPQAWTKPRSKNTHPAGRSAAARRSAIASSMARRAKTALFNHGSAEPSPTNSCFTMRRPGSSTVAWPRRPSSANSVDLPLLEQLEITTKRSLSMLFYLNEFFLSVSHLTFLDQPLNYFSEHERMAARLK